MPKITYADHPVHPVVSAYPSALVPASLVFDMLHLMTRRGAFKVASFWTLVFALVSGGAAAATGVRDYREIPEGSEAKRLANAHGLLHAGLLASLALQVMMRITGRVGFRARILNVAANAGLLAANWYGTHLVREQGVQPAEVDPTRWSSSAAADRGAGVASALEGAVNLVPATDLSGFADHAGDVASIAGSVAAFAGDVAASAGRQAQDVIGAAAGEVGARVEALRSRASDAVNDIDGAVSDVDSDFDESDTERIERRLAEAAAEVPDFDDQGALSGSIPDGEPADVAASVRQSLDDATG